MPIVLKASGCYSVLNDLRHLVVFRYTHYSRVREHPAAYTKQLKSATYILTASVIIGTLLLCFLVPSNNENI